MALGLFNKLADLAKTSTRMVVLGIIVIVVGLVWLGWTKVIANPDTVFWSMLDNNLSSYGQTKHVTQGSQGNSLDQYVQLQLGSQNVASGQAALDQALSNTTEASITIDTIGTSSANYARYTNFALNSSDPTQPKKDFSQLIGVWAKENNFSSAQQAIFTQASEGIIPSMHLSSQIRHQVVDFAKKQQVYKIDFSSLKHETINGRMVDTYQVQVDPEKYIQMLILINKLTDQKSQQLDASQYQGAPAVPLQVSVDVLSHNLVNVIYETSGRSESYGSYGAQATVDIPTQTISETQAQAMLQKILSSQ